MRLVNLLCGWWTLLVFVFLYLPIVLLIVYSFNTSRLNVNFEGFAAEGPGGRGRETRSPDPRGDARGE